MMPNFHYFSAFRLLLLEYSFEKYTIPHFESVILNIHDVQLRSGDENRIITNQRSHCLNSEYIICIHILAVLISSNQRANAYHLSNDYR